MQKRTAFQNLAPNSPSLMALTASALLLPGMLLSPTPAFAADDDEIDFQYSHYAESWRNVYGLYRDNFTGKNSPTKLPSSSQYHPIEVDSLRGLAKISLSDRSKLAFNYTEDTWSGATPVATAPIAAFANHARIAIDSSGALLGGATPYLKTNELFVDKQGNFLYDTNVQDSAHQPIFQRNNGTTHVISYASPETRKQGDMELRYEGDEATIEGGGGLSLENDYESRFVNLGGSLDFDQKRTRVNGGVSYTNSHISATIDPVGFGFFGKDNYLNQIEFAYDKKGPTLATGGILHGTRQDWSTRLGLTQVLNKDALLSLGIDYTRNTGFLENPYKVVNFYYLNPNAAPVFNNVYAVTHTNFIEQRPDARNLLGWNSHYAQYINGLNAALQVNYHFVHDDWGINAHTFDASWGQPLGLGWTLTPNIRYYSQDAANFYHPYIFTRTTDTRPPSKTASFSSDQRLSGFGALSGGLTISKQFTKGVSLEAGVEYYNHAGSLKLGGGGEGSYADFNYYTANAAIKLNLDALGSGGSSSGHSHTHHQHQDLTPAGLMFAHSLPQAEDFMVGYRYMYSRQSGDLLHGSQPVSVNDLFNHACGKLLCNHYPKEMNMQMHMLDLMVAPTDWLTLMLMPQFVDMDMNTGMGKFIRYEMHGMNMGAPMEHASGGVGDTGVYALFKLWDTPIHHLHVTAGLSAPTGAVDIQQRKTPHTGFQRPLHFGMQLGSGTWDVKPSLTYSGQLKAWSWGAQVADTWRPQSHNDTGYALGDMFQSSVWGGYQLTSWLTGTLRGVYNWEGQIRGDYNHITAQCLRSSFEQADGHGGIRFDDISYQQCLKLENDYNNRLHTASFDNTSNYGGHYVDVGFGLNVNIPNGAFAGHHLKFEWLQPVYTHVNGYQLDRSGALSFTWGLGF